MTLPNRIGWHTGLANRRKGVTLCVLHKQRKAKAPAKSPRLTKRTTATISEESDHVGDETSDSRQTNGSSCQIPRMVFMSTTSHDQKSEGRDYGATRIKYLMSAGEYPIVTCHLVTDSNPEPKRSSPQAWTIGLARNARVLSWSQRGPLGCQLQ